MENCFLCEGRNNKHSKMKNFWYKNLEKRMWRLHNTGNKKVDIWAVKFDALKHNVQMTKKENDDKI